MTQATHGGIHFRFAQVRRQIIQEGCFLDTGRRQKSGAFFRKVEQVGFFVSRVRDELNKPLLCQPIGNDLDVLSGSVADIGNCRDGEIAVLSQRL